VVDVAIKYEYLNHTPDEIINAYPHLKLEQIHDALSFYYENRAELDEKIREDEQFIQKLAATQKGRWLTIDPKRIKIYADESVNIAIVEGLKRRGVLAFSAKDLGKLGLTDEEQLEIAAQKQAVILTNDADFIKIALHKKHLGIIYVHQRKMTIGECVKRLRIIAETQTAQQMNNQLIFL
jgi:predicted nuclease of predicted toxin-antitoxin system